MSSATPLPTALAIVTLPARAAPRMPGQPITESGPELHRIEEVVVDPAVDDVDPLLALRRTKEDHAVATDEVATLDELDAHLPGKQRVLEVGRVVGAWRQQDDHRVSDPGGRGRAQRRQQATGVAGHPTHPFATEQVGRAPGPSCGGSPARS